MKNNCLPLPEGILRKGKMICYLMGFLEWEKMGYFLFAEEILKKGKIIHLFPGGILRKGKLIIIHRDWLSDLRSDLRKWHLGWDLLLNQEDDRADGRWQQQQGTVLNGSDVGNQFLGTFFGVNCSLQIYIQYQLKHVCDRTITVAQSNSADWKRDCQYITWITACNIKYNIKANNIMMTALKNIEWQMFKMGFLALSVSYSLQH